MWTPRVVVVSSARTYSAAFDVVAMLHAHGAELVGVPSAQAGNCFIDSLSFELKNSHIRGHLGFKRSLSFPHEPGKGRLLRPDMELTYDTLSRMSFDPHAALRLAQKAALDGAHQPSLEQQMPSFVWKGELDGALAWLAHKYKLREVIAGETDELEQILSLRNWIHGRWAHDSWNTPESFDALSILEDASHGKRFRCVEYALVLAQVYRAMGWQARFVRLAGQGAHAVTEVFTKKHKKWLLMDGQHAAHVTRNGLPIGVRELRDALRAKEKVEAPVDGRPLDYIEWVGGMLDTIMVSRNVSYGHELDALVVLLDPGQEAPKTKPHYLRSTTYLITRDADVLKSSPPLF